MRRQIRGAAAGLPRAATVTQPASVRRDRAMTLVGPGTARRKRRRPGWANSELGGAGSEPSAAYSVVTGLVPGLRPGPAPDSDFNLWPGGPD